MAWFEEAAAVCYSWIFGVGALALGNLFCSLPPRRRLGRLVAVLAYDAR